MALEKQRLEINFAQGLDLKSDEKQVPFGRFLRLKNSVFKKIGLLQKRNGFQQLAALPDTTSTYTTTFAGNLTAIGTSVRAYSNPSNTWIDKGHLQPVELSTLSLFRNSISQTACDAMVSENGLACVTFSDSGQNYYYQIMDSTTGQVLAGPTVLAADSSNGFPRVFILGNYFVIFFSSSTANHLKYIPISLNSLIVGAAVDVSTAYTSNSKGAFNGVVANNNLYMAWNGNDMGGAIRLVRLDSTLAQHSTKVVSSVSADIVSMCADNTTSTPTIYVTIWKSNATSTAVFDSQLNTITDFTSVSSDNCTAITSSAQNGSVQIFEEVVNTYTYDTSIATHYVKRIPMTSAGAVGTTATVLRSVGLASKSFIISGTIYMLCIYSSSYQPTYFLTDSSGNVVAKLAYSNGGGYLTTGLPSALVRGSSVSIAYLIRDMIIPVNKSQAASNAGLGVFAQTGVNLATFTITTSDIVTSEIAKVLHLSGGFMWMYDGANPVEHSFHLWPDSVEAVGATSSGSVTSQTYYYQATYEWVDNQGNLHRSAPSLPVTYVVATPPTSFTGNRTSGSPIITSVSSETGLQVGQLITGTGIPASTYILSIDSGTQITMTHNASSGSSTSTTITPTAVTAISVNIPTLRLTYKTATPVNIVLYRWSTAQQTYYQVTGVSSPLQNSKTVDYVTYTDTSADSSIIGNNILYTTGGVVENVAAPASDTMALYKSRLITLDAEDKNLLWYSKQVIESTPVEMSDLFTIYIAPTESVGGSSGPITALSAMDDKLIIFKQNAIYYITGNGPDNTGTNNDFSDPVFITSTVGCANQNSIVFTPSGLMFQSDKGIWLLGRDLSTTYIGASVEDFNVYEVFSAIDIPSSNEVRFTLSNGITLVYNYFFGQWATFEGIPGVASTVFEGLHTFINSYAQVFQENPGSFLDGTNPVLMGFTTGWFNMLGLQGFDRAYWMNLIGEFISPHYLIVNIAYEYLDASRQLSTVSPTNYNLPYGGDPLWGSSFVYGGNSTLEQWRVFFQRQRCQAFQISVDEIFNAAYGTQSGEGLTLSGISLIYGGKGIYPRLSAAKSTG